MGSKLYFTVRPTWFGASHQVIPDTRTGGWWAVPVMGIVSGNSGS